MEWRRDDLDLAAELRALRPTPDPGFTAALDARMAEGFPRQSPTWKAPIGRIAARFRTTAPRRLLAPVGALTIAAIAISVAISVVVTSESDRGHAPLGSTRFSEPAPSPSATAQEKGASGAAEMLSGTGRLAAPAAGRNVERAAQIVLGSDPAEVRSVAAEVFDAVHAFDGIVLDSSIREGSTGNAGASFDLLIPSGKLGDALAAFSGIAEVRSRHEATRDITAPTVGVGERLQDTEAKIEGLLAQLSGTETDDERAAVETELRAERRHAAALRSRLDSLRRRANLSRVSLRIETGTAAATSTDGSWGAGEALGDAGRILAVAAGVAVIAIAILAPLALICVLAWLAQRWLARRGRERALGLQR